MGDLLRISLRNNDGGVSSDWHLDRVLIVDSNAKEYRFPANVWLSHEAGRQLDVMLSKGMIHITLYSSTIQRNLQIKLDLRLKIFKVFKEESLSLSNYWEQIESALLSS